MTSDQAIAEADGYLNELRKRFDGGIVEIFETLIELKLRAEYARALYLLANVVRSRL